MLADRVRALEDRAAINDLIARYGPAADAGDGDAVGALWAEDGEYWIGGSVLTGSEIAGLVEFDTHREYLSRGCAHVLSAPLITVEGDRAEAINHSVVLVRSDARWDAERVSANRWEFVRTGEGWRVVRRENHLLDGSEDARSLLAPRRGSD